MVANPTAALCAASLEGENYKEALEGFQKVVSLEKEQGEKGEWCGALRLRCRYLQFKRMPCGCLIDLT